MKVFEELRQRKVLQTAALYFAVAWGATEILSYLIERIPVFPAWADTAIAILFVLGFPVAVFLAWMFDVGEGGVRRADPGTGLGKGVIVLSVMGLLVATGALSYLIWPSVQAERGLVAEGDLGTVAVLPFENLTGDPSLGYLGVGLAEDIRQRLLAQTDLKIIGRVSMAGFGSTGTDLASIRGLLDAGLVLEGSLQNIAGQLQVNIALLDTASGKQLWGNAFSAGKREWGPLRQRIVTTLAEQLELTVRVREADAPVPDAALEAHLRGLATLNEPEVADGWFDEAVRVAPDFADAWARKALLRVDMIWHGLAGQQGWEEATPLLARARAIEPDNLLADIAEAQLHWLARYDPISAYEVLLRAEERAPNHPLVVGGIANSLRYIPDKLKDAETYSRRYLALDPLNPDAHLILGTALTFQHKYEEGFPHYDRAEELDPGYLLTYEFQANQEFFRRSPASALAALTRRARVEGGASEETQRCMVYIAGELLPPKRAVALLEDAIRRGVGMTDSHAWCAHPLETLLSRVEELGDTEKLEMTRAELERFREAGGDITNFQGRAWKIETADACEDELCRIRAQLGDEEMEAWLGPDPPISAFTGEQAWDIAQALQAAGREAEARTLAAKTGAVLHDYAGPRGHPSLTAWAVLLMAMSGDTDGALEYAEQVGPEGFYMFGVGLDSEAAKLGIPGFSDSPRWQAFQERCQARWLQDVDKFDQLVAAGEIVMPFPLPGPSEEAGLE